MKKMGTVIALKSEVLNGEVYLGEGNVLTPNIGMAKTFRAPAKVLTTIKTQAIARYPELKFVASQIERWVDNV